LSFEVEYRAQCDVDLNEFLRGQTAREVAEALRVDGGGLLDQYPDILAEEFDGGMDASSGWEPQVASLKVRAQGGEGQ
jgi:hypothetical protein